MNTDDLTKKLRKISEMLEIGKELIPEDAIIKFQDASQRLESELNDIMEKGRDLRLGIVGEVKAGKSSFLNALLFEGQDILPKAPTPMTAALTRISYSDTPKAKIVFYDENDWNSIKGFADKYERKMEELYQTYTEEISVQKEKWGIGKEAPVKAMSKEEFEKAKRGTLPMEYVACKEVYDMAALLNVEQYLGTEKIIGGTYGNDYGYLHELDEYVGVKGRYTPIVKYTEISLCNKLLEGIEVVDTPGMNDPILSRGRTTQNFLIQCDAVFCLSYCGQFLGVNDMGFIMSSLPDEGISQAVLIGSKMDSAILTYPSKGNPSFKNAYLGTKKNCDKQARHNIEECAESLHNKKLLTQLKESLPPFCISSLAYSAARQIQNGKTLNPGEKNMLDNLCKRFPDFTNNVETLIGLSSIPDVRQKVFEEIRKKKNQIIQDRKNDLAGSQIVRFQKILEDIHIQTTSNQNDLKTHDCEQLKEQLTSFKERLDAVRITVRERFNRAAVEAKARTNEIVVITGQKMEEYAEISDTTITTVIPQSKKEGILWWSRTVRWEETIYTRTAKVSDAYSNIRKYRLDCMKIINAEFKDIIGIKEFKEEIKRVIMTAFDQTAKNFDERKILIPLETALRGIALPDFVIGFEQYEEALDKELGGIVSNGIVKDEDISVLQKVQGKILSRMSLDIEKRIRNQGDEICRKLQKEAVEFIDKIVKQLEGNQKKLEQMIEDKEAGLEKFDVFIRMVSEAKSMLCF